MGLHNNYSVSIDTQVFVEHPAMKKNFVDDIQKKRDDVLQQLEGQHGCGEDKTEGTLPQLLRFIKGVKRKADIASAKEQLADLGKTFKRDKVKEFNSSMSHFGRTKAANARASKTRRAKAAVAAPRSVEAVEASPRFHLSIVDALHGEDFPQPGTSLLEAKCGQRVALLRPKPGVDLVADLNLCAPFRAALKVAQKAFAQEALEQQIVQFNEAPKYKRLLKDLRKFYDGQLFTSLPLPQADWAQQLYRVQLFHFGPKFCFAGYNPNCLCEAKAVIAGALFIGCFRVEAVPGKTFRDKRAMLLNASSDQLSVLLKDERSMLCRVPPGQVLVIPSGFLVVITTEKETYGLRWGISADDSDTERVGQNVVYMMQAYPALAQRAGGVTKQWHDFLFAY